MIGPCAQSLYNRAVLLSPRYGLLSPRFVLAVLMASGLIQETTALELAPVELKGVDGELASNVRAQLSLERLTPTQRSAISETQLAYLLRAAPAEARRGLEPFGYYDAVVTPELVRQDGQVRVRLSIVLGEPVRVRQVAVAVTGPAKDDAVVAARVAGFHPVAGEVFLHAVYEAGKAGIARSLSERGYFDAELGLHRVEVTRAAHAADIGLGWTSGPRYSLGPVRFEGSQLRAGVLDPLVRWKPGEPYDHARLLALQQSLADADYFSGISLEPEPEQARDGQVPIKVTLVPAKRSIYNLGLRYGTDSGLGINARGERRWLNDRGHKLITDLNLAQFKSDFTVQYRIPAFSLRDGWVTFGATLRDEEVEGSPTRYIEVSAARSGRWRDWTLLAALNFKRERFDIPDTDQFDYATVVYPSAWGQWKRSDDVNTPRRGRGVTLEVRAGSSALGSDIDFLQLRAEGRYIRGLGADNRLLLRGEVGTTFTHQFAQFPPSMRLHAGGDKSLRGYGYQELAGQHLALGSVEFEHMFTPVWGAAAFVDAGNAFDEAFNPQVGVGIGLRWRSVVGPVRLDIAHGIGQPEQSYRLHISVGPDL